MNWLDILLTVVLVVGLFFGVRAGLIKVVLSLAGLVVGIVLASRLYMPLAERLTFVSLAWAKVIAFAIIFIIVMVVAAVLARFLKWAVSAITLGWVNRLGGAIFGVLLGAIVMGAILALWAQYFGPNRTITESVLAALLLDKFPLVLGLLPREFDAIRSFFR
ncbi:MAG: CvpA family protein [Chloroflexi bacterium]|nr:CvpA family protein [Chloroflexota bacterium]